MNSDILIWPRARQLRKIRMVIKSFQDWWSRRHLIIDIECVYVTLKRTQNFILILTWEDVLHKLLAINVFTVPHRLLLLLYLEIQDAFEIVSCLSTSEFG